MPTVRVLIVTDDGAANGGFLPWTTQTGSAVTGPNSREFHLGEFVRVLTDTAWVGFTLEITRAHRGSGDAAFQADRGADVINFRFDGTHTVGGVSRTLADYDMALLFSIDPVDPQSGDPARVAEAEAIAAFMEEGRGFFATGDHENLGAGLAGLVPRVRNMRRWWFETVPPGEVQAPDALNADRHDTTQAGHDGVRQFEDQSDDVAQPIAPTLYGAGVGVAGGYIVYKSVPHPLLCSPDGIVRYLPDHMHEGQVEVPADLTRTFTIAGTVHREYPDYHGAPLAPEIVATGRVEPGTTSPEIDPAHTGGTIPTHGLTFGVIGAWDGHRVGKGRVVVDSTWHHFFNINLTGDRFLEDDGLGSDQRLHGFFVGGAAVPEYQAIQWYYRNIIYWLIPASRHRPLLVSAILRFIDRPQLAEELAHVRDYKRFDFGSVRYYAQLAEDYFNSTRGHCYNFNIRQILYKPKIPWWEWVQEIVDVWDPAIAQKNPREVIRDQAIGALGVGPQLETALRVGLGSAVIAAATLRREHGRATDKIVPLFEHRFEQVFEHSLGLYREELKRGRETAAKLAELASPKSAR